MPCSYFYPHRMYKEDYRLIDIKGKGEGVTWILKSILF